MSTNLRVLDLQECDIEDLSGHWLSHFPDSFTSLETLNMACLGSEVSFSALERLVARSPYLKTLRLNRTVPLDKLSMLLQRAPQLVEFGTGSYSADIRSDIYSSLADAFSACKNLQGLSGFWDLVPAYLPAFYSVCSQLTSLNLSYATTQSPDLTKIVSQNCKDLRRLSMSGLLTDRVFEYIGKHAKKLDMLSIAFAGESDLGLHHVLSGCDSLRKLEIRDCPFGDKALLANASKLETMRSLWMSSCGVSFGACKLLGRMMPGLNVEVIDERENLNSVPENVPVEKLYIYRTVAGQRFDMPDFVRTMGKDEVLDYIEDTGLNALAMSCKDLRELRVFPSDPFVADANVLLTEEGLVSVSEGCPKLHSVLYFCRQMTNTALISIARNRPNFTCFRLCILEPRAPDHLTFEPLDVGFGAIVENCKDLRRLSMSGLLTDRVFEYIGKHAKKLDMLSIAFAGESDLGLHHVLSGKLEIRDCPFGDKALLANASKLETMRSLWMSSCGVSFGACKLLGRMMPGLNVEVIDERENLNSVPENVPVEKLYIYRTVAGQRFDMPDFVRTMGKDELSLCLALLQNPSGAFVFVPEEVNFRVNVAVVSLAFPYVRQETPGTFCIVPCPPSLQAYTPLDLVPQALTYSPSYISILPRIVTFSYAINSKQLSLCLALLQNPSGAFVFVPEEVNFRVNVAVVSLAFPYVRQETPGTFCIVPVTPGTGATLDYGRYCI
nr:hypothetical protein [Tanacetum cinerariifolium]